MSVPTIPLIQKRPDVNNQQLEFFWSAPLSDGGSPITSYYLSDGTNNYTLPVTDYYNLTGLTNGTTYSFTLAASNANGLGEASYFTPVQPGIEPGPPTLVSTINAGNYNYQIVFQNNSNIGSNTRLLGTLLTAIPLDANSNLSTNSSLYIYSSVPDGFASAQQIGFLTLNSNYNFQIRLESINDPGYSLTKVFTSTLFLIPPTAFSPSSFAGMQLWLDAADTTTYSTNISSVTRWNSKGPVNIILSSVNVVGGIIFPQRVGSTIAGLSTLTFINGNTQIRQGTTYDGVKNFFWVGQQGAFTGYPNLLGHDSVLDWQSAVSPYSYAGYTGSENTVRFASSILYANNSNFISTLGGQPVASTNTTFLLDAYNFYSSTRWQGIAYDRGFDGRGWNGNLGEVIMYSNAMSTLQRQTVEGYLAWKWGLSTLLPSYHPFYTRKPFASDSNLDFSPSSIAGVKLWLDAQDSTTFVVSSATSTILRWNDKSGAGNNMIASGTPILSTNFVHMNGTNAFFSTVGFTEPAITNMFVFNQTGGTGWIYTTRTDSATNGLVTNGGGFFYYDVGAAGWPAGLTVMPLNTLQMVETQYNGNVAGSTIVMYSNANVYTVSSLVNSTIRSQFFLGSRQVPANLDYFSGRFHEVLHFSTVLSLQQRQQAEGYLAWKWGLQGRLPSTHLYYFRPPTNKDTFTSFSPSSITGLALNFDASDPTTYTIATGSSVNAWTTKLVSPAITFSQNVSSNQPQIVPNVKNGLSVMRMSNAAAPTYAAYFSSVISTATIVSSFNTCVFLVHNPTQDNASPFQALDSGSLRIGVHTPSGDNIVFDYGNIGVSRLGYSLGTGGGVTYRAEGFKLECFYVSTGTQIYRKNGSTLASMSAQSPAFPSTMTVGIGTTVSDFINYNYRTDIGEVLWYRTPLNVTQVQQIEGYLSWKWGLQSNLSPTHPYRYGSTISIGPISTATTF